MICCHESTEGLLSTFGVWGGPGDDAPHQAAIEQHFLREAVVPAEMLQVLPPLGPLGRRTHGWNFSSIAKHSGTSMKRRSKILPKELGICGKRDSQTLKFWTLRKMLKPVEVAEVLCKTTESMS